MLANIGSAEALIIIVALAILFGSKKTTDIARGAGEATKEFKKAKRELDGAVQELKKPIDEAEPMKKSELETAEAAKTESTMKGGEEKNA